MTDDPNKPLTGAEFDLDRLIHLYEPDGTSVMTTPRHLTEGGNMTLQDVIAVERFGETHYSQSPRGTTTPKYLPQAPSHHQ
jgi:hypothetical protein